MTDTQPKPMLSHAHEEHALVQRAQGAANSDPAATLDSPSSESLPGLREVVVGTRPMEDETHALLRRRLRAAVILMLVAFSAYLIRNLFVAERPRLLMVLHVLVLFSLSISLTLLQVRRDFTIRQLRGLELFSFGVPVAFLCINQAIIVSRAAQANDSLTAIAVTKSTVLYFFGMIVTYGTFIPNTWRRALAVVLPIALLPPVTAIVLRVTNDFHIIDQQIAVPEQISDNILMLALGALMAVASTHVINRLRVEAFAARQLAQYRLSKRLGVGAMGEVYLAEHQLLKRPCAVKLIRPERSQDPKLLARFAREVKATARLSHWNTVDIFDYGVTEDGTFFYVMEYLPGRSLEDLVNRFGVLHPARAIYLARQLCQALTEAHSHGLIHRDIKPSNVFVAYRGGMFDVAKLLDFGLVKPVVSADGQLTLDGDITGSPHYMSPEQASGRNTDARSDIYALGAVLYFMVAGRPPHEGENALQIMIAHVRDPLAPPSNWRSDLADDLEKVIVRCLQRAPEQRFQGPIELEAALAACGDAGQWDPQMAHTWWSKHGLAEELKQVWPADHKTIVE